jgi:GTP-binding protein
MVDVSNYRSLNEQLEKLKIELERYSDELPKREYAIVLSKIDVNEDENIVDNFLNDMYNKDDFIQEKDAYFLKEEASWNEDIKNNNKLPRFIMPISSVSNTNLEELKFALYKIINN